MEISLPSIPRAIVKACTKIRKTGSTGETEEDEAKGGSARMRQMLDGGG